MPKKRPDRLERLEEALYSRNEARLPKVERAGLTPEENPENLRQSFFNDVPLEDVVSREREHPHRKIFEKAFLISLVFVVMASGYAGYKFFLGGPSVSDSNINIAVAGPSIVSAGSPVALDIRVENHNAQAISNVVLKIEYPKDARSVTERTKALADETNNIGNLGSGKSAAKQASFVVYGQKDDVETLTVHLEYGVAGSKATFIKEQTFDIVIGTAPVIFNVSAPSTVVSKQPFDMAVSIKSNSPDVINNVILSADYPFGFSFVSSDVTTFTNDNVWHLGDMVTGDTKIVHIRGVLEAENAEERTFKFTVASPGANSSALSQIASDLETVAVSKPFLSLNVGVAGGSQENSTQAGDRIPIEISWGNNLSVQVTNAVIKATISGVFDQTGIVAEFGGFYNSKDQSITWQQSSDSDLKSIGPGASGKVRFTLAIPRLLPANAKNQGVTLHVVMTGDQQGTNSSSNQISTDANLSFKFRANPSASAYATRQSSAFQQKGPVPPKVNTETTYSIVMSAGTSFADINNATLNAVLPPNVSWNNLVSPGNERLTFDSNSRVLSWAIGNIVAGDPNRTATIQLSITPSVSQVGISPSLLTRAVLSGTDVFTGEPVSINLNDVTTELIHDSGAPQNSGAVVK